MLHQFVSLYLNIWNLTKTMLSSFVVKTPTLDTFSAELENYMKLKLSKQGMYTDTVRPK